MRSVWKFPLQFAELQSLKMPANAQILCVQVQGGQPCLWALVDIDAAKERRVIRIVGTGHPAPTEPQARYIGTFQGSGGAFIWHVFEVPDQGPSGSV